MCRSTGCSGSPFTSKSLRAVGTAGMCVDLAVQKSKLHLSTSRPVSKPGTSPLFCVWCVQFVHSSSHVGNVTEAPPCLCHPLSLTRFSTGRSWTVWLTASCSVPSFPARSAQASWSSRVTPTTAQGTSLPGPSVWLRHRHPTGRNG